MARTIQLELSSNFGFNPNTRTWLCIENHCRIASFQSGKIREILAVIEGKILKMMFVVI